MDRQDLDEGVINWKATGDVRDAWMDFFDAFKPGNLVERGMFSFSTFSSLVSESSSYSNLKKDTTLRQNLYSLLPRVYLDSILRDSAACFSALRFLVNSLLAHPSLRVSSFGHHSSQKHIYLKYSREYSHGWVRKLRVFD